jgi:Tol biopolymer transport system component
MRIRNLATALLALCSAAGAVAAQTTIRASVSSSGDGTNKECSRVAISLDGRSVSFATSATNLVEGDTNGFLDVFVHDLSSGVTERASVGSRGEEGNDHSFRSAVSGDGRYVAFASQASNLVAGDINGFSDIFVRDRWMRTTTLVTRSWDGDLANGHSGIEGVSLSADGRFVAFDSWAGNLVPGDTNASPDVFVHDRDPDQNGIFDEGNGVTTRASVDSSGEEAFLECQSCAISADGKVVAFDAKLRPGLIERTFDPQNRFVFARDLAAGTTTMVSVDSQGHAGNAFSAYPALSADGRLVEFSSDASNLVPGDTNFTADVFVHDRATGVTVVASVSSDGELGNDTSLYASLSASGRYVAFRSEASNLIPDDTNGDEDCFVHDLANGRTVRVSLTADGKQSDGPARPSPVISDNGRFVAFGHHAALVPDDTNGVDDIYVRDWCPAGWTNYGTGWPGSSGIPALTASGDPQLCTQQSLEVSNSLGQPTSGLLLAGLARAELPTAWNGTLWLIPLLAVPLDLPSGGVSVPAPIPCDPTLCGLVIDLQVIEFDAGASRGISFTPALELSLGV